MALTTFGTSHITGMPLQPSISHFFCRGGPSFSGSSMYYTTGSGSLVVNMIESTQRSARNLVVLCQQLICGCQSFFTFIFFNHYPNNVHLLQHCFFHQLISVILGEGSHSWACLHNSILPTMSGRAIAACRIYTTTFLFVMLIVNL